MNSTIRRIAMFDYNTRAAEGDAPGIERPVAVVFQDGETSTTFRNDKGGRALPWRERHIAPGGLTDHFLQMVFGEKSGTLPDHRRRYMADRYHLFGFRRAFDTVFVLAWLHAHRLKYDFHIYAHQATIFRIDVWTKDTPKETGHWSFFEGPPPKNEDGSIAVEYDAEQYARIEKVRRTLRSLDARAAETLSTLTAHERALLHRRLHPKRKASP